MIPKSATHKDTWFCLKSDHWMKFINDGFYYTLALHCVVGVGEDSGYGA